MTTRMKTVLATLIAPAFAAGTAHAAETGFYFGGSVGESTMKAKTTKAFDDGEGGFDVNTFDFDKTETGYKAFVGYNFLPFLGVEGGYVDFGSPSDGQSFGPLGLDRIDAEVEATGWEAFLVATLPIGPVDLFIKGGGIESSIDFKVKVHDDTLGTTAHDTESESNEMLAYGAGAAINFGNFAIRVEAEGYDVDKLDDLYFISVGATYHM